jgi:hypothetical protein
MSNEKDYFSVSRRFQKMIDEKRASQTLLLRFSLL